VSLNHLVVHQLTRLDTKTDLHLQDETLPVNDAALTLVGEVKSSFAGRASKRYGGFAAQAGHFKALTSQWLRDGITFKTWSQQIMERLALALENDGIESDGHWLFADEQLESGRQVWVFQLRHKHGLSVTHDLNLSNSQLIDYGRLGFGACLNVSDWEQAEASQYLTVSFGFGDKALQDALLNFVDFVATVDTSADTEAFMAVVDAFSAQLPADKGQNYRKKAAEFCIEQDKMGEPVSYRVLSEELQADADSSFSKYIEQEQPTLKETFIPDRKSLKKYIRYSGRSKDVSISFSNINLGKDIQFDADNERLIIHEIPASLLKQLRGV
jgi:nucleoid-associated protein